MTDPLDSLYRPAGFTEPDPQFRSALMARLEQSLAQQRTDGEFPVADQIAEQPELLEVVISTPPTRHGRTRPLVLAVSGVAAAVVLIVGLVVLTRDHGSRVSTPSATTSPQPDCTKNQNWGVVELNIGNENSRGIDFDPTDPVSGCVITGAVVRYLEITNGDTNGVTLYYQQPNTVGVHTLGEFPGQHYVVSVTGLRLTVAQEWGLGYIVSLASDRLTARTVVNACWVNPVNSPDDACKQFGTDTGGGGVPPATDVTVVVTVI